MVKSKRKVTENQTFHRLHHDPRMLPIYNRLLSRCDSKEVTCEEHKLKSKQGECPFYKEVRKQFKKEFEDLKNIHKVICDVRQGSTNRNVRGHVRDRRPGKSV